MIKRILVTSIGMPSVLLKARDGFGQKIVKPVLQELVAYWHANFLPRHFQPGAAAKYGYQKRKPATWRRKRRAAAAGNAEAMLPLIMRGDTKRQVSRAIRISGTAKSATGRMQAPRVVTHTLRAGLPNYAQEITTVSADEQRGLARLCRNMIIERMNANQEKTTEVI